MVNNCPFCNFSLIKGRILHKEKHWYILESINPISNPHFLIISNRHIRTFNEVLPEEMKSYFKCLKFIYKHNDCDFFSYTNGKESQEVSHLHIHLFRNFLKPTQLHEILVNIQG